MSSPPGIPAPRHEGLPTAVVLHALVQVLFLSWSFGGAAGWAEAVLDFTVVAGWVLLLWGLARGRSRQGRGAMAAVMAPMLLFMILQLAASFNPSMTRMEIGGGEVLVARESAAWLPASADPGATLRELWRMAGLWVAGLNLWLFAGRRHLRAVLAVVAANAALLAVYGTFQKFSGAGYYFGAADSPNPFFFATFIYHNHWAAFALLSTGAALALMMRELDGSGMRSFSRGPGPLAAVAAALAALTVPLAGSRSGVLLLAVLLPVLGIQIAAGRRVAVRWKIAGVASLCLLVAAAAWLALDLIRVRLEHTRLQVAEMRQLGTVGARADLYRDTLRMWRERPAAGWGLETYALVFPSYNRQISVEGWRMRYSEAHSDWLQGLAETGVAGMLLLVAAGLMPPACAGWRALRHPAVRQLLLGCGLVLVLALVEVPLANRAVMALFCILWFTAAAYARRNGHAAAATQRPCSPY